METNRAIALCVTYRMKSIYPVGTAKTQFPVLQHRLKNDMQFCIAENTFTDLNRTVNVCGDRVRMECVRLPEFNGAR